MEVGADGAAAVRGYRFADFHLDIQRELLLREGIRLPFEPRTFRLLVYLIENRDRRVAKDELLDRVWEGAFVTENALTRAVARLRKALGDDAHVPRFIATVPTRGYRFVHEVAPVLEDDATDRLGQVGHFPSASSGWKWRRDLAVVTLILGSVMLVSGWARTIAARKLGANADSTQEQVQLLGVTPEEQEPHTAAAPNSLDAYDCYLQGAQLLQAQDEESTGVALLWFEQALEIDPEMVEAHVGLGAAHSMRYFNSWSGVDDLRLAEESFLAALRLEPASARARRGLIRIEMELGRSDEVLIHAREARRAGRPDDVESLLAQAEGYALGGLPELSLPILRRILQLDPRNKDASWWLVIAAAWTGESESAVQAAEAYLTEFGDDPMVHTWAGYAHYVLGRQDRADAHYRQAIAGPTDLASLIAQLFLGHLQQESGRQYAAHATWKTGHEAVRHRLVVLPNSPRLQVLKAAFAICLDDVPSQDALHKLFDKSTLEVSEVGLLAAALARRGDWHRSAELLRNTLDGGHIFQIWESYFRGLGLDPDSPRLHGFQENLDAKARELRVKFGPTDPPGRVSAR